jgi:hypothetical protein
MSRLIAALILLAAANIAVALATGIGAPPSFERRQRCKRATITHARSANGAADDRARCQAYRLLHLKAESVDDRLIKRSREEVGAWIR